ncbi:MAG: acyl-CoA dehydrogenase [Alphaproteobacteria bacterium]
MKADNWNWLWLFEIWRASFYTSVFQKESAMSVNISKSILSFPRQMLPPLSQTEKEALESGSVGWDGELLSGHPDWSKLFELKKPQLTEEELAFLDGPVEELCKMLNKSDIEQANDIPEEAWAFLKKQGFMGLELPKEYGGKGFSAQGHSAIIMKLASRGITAGMTVMVPNSLGPGKLILAYGTQEQKDYYLPRLARGEEIPCFALTEPEAGSDAGSISSYGVVCRNEKGEIGIRITCDKRFITLAPISTLIGMAIRLEDPDGLLGTKKDLGITVALVPSNTPGLDIGARHHPMDLPFQNGPIVGTDAFVPLDSIIGGLEKAGQGWKMVAECLAIGRALSLPAASVAAAQLCSYASGSYSRIRRQFNMPIGKFGGIEELLGRMAGETYKMDAARSLTLQMIDQGQQPAVASAIVKCHLTEGMRKIVLDAMDIHGGKGICNGPNNILVEIYKSSPIAINVEGHNVMTRNLMIFPQAVFCSHPYFLKEIVALENPNDNQALGQFSLLMAQHAGNSARSASKSLWYGVTSGGKSPVNDKDTEKYYREVNRLCAAFSIVADATVVRLGSALKREERTSARLGDVLSNLYMASAVLWGYEKKDRPKEELPLVHWACTQALYDAEDALDQTLINHPSKRLGKNLRPFVFPVGKHNAKPTDEMCGFAADCIREPGPMRDKFAANLYMPKSLDEPLGVLAEAFTKSIECEPLEKKIAVALKNGTLKKNKRAALLAQALTTNVLTQAEVDLMRRTDKLRSDVVKVDAFKPTAAPAPVGGGERPCP